MTEINMNDVVARAQGGSPDAVSALYSSYYQRIYRFLYFRTGDMHIAEDLTGEVFIKMVQALPDYHAEGTPFQAWLFQVARNLAIDYHRRNYAHPTVEIDENLNWQADSLDQAIDTIFTCEELARGLGQVDETQRDVLLFRFIEGMSIAETALALHKSIDAVKALQRRGLMALRIIIQSGEDGHG